ncbi:MAG: hypothetical protein K6D98_04750, partial [Clostridiales bacterium]|nr:hypothetical protein [Clostridiales bacterium]
MKRRIAAGILALFMCFTLMPVEVFSQVLKSEPERIEKTETLYEHEIESDESDESGVQLALSDSGEEAETVKIGTADELAAFADRVNDGENELNAELTADIVLPDTIFTVISGLSEHSFNGTFDGKGHSIKLNGKNSFLFAYIGEEGTVKNLALCGTVESGNYCGLALYNYGITEKCFSTASLTGTEGIAASFADNNHGIIRNCYNVGNITDKTGHMGCGGIAGRNYGKIENCYNIGKVSVEDGNPGASGIVAYNYGTVENCYVLSGQKVCSSGTASNCSALAKAEFADKTKFATFDFDNVWIMGKERPLLKDNTEKVKIGTAEDLQNFSNRVNAGEKTLCAELTADIDLTDILFSGIGFTSGDAFNGTFDGKGFSIKSDDNTPVIFGYTGENSVIKNLTVCGTITSKYDSCIVYENYGTVEYCRNLADITVERNAGGIVYYNFGTVRYCYNAGNITVSRGSSLGAGIAAYNKGKIENCYNVGNLYADQTANCLGGGIAAYNEKTIENCYNFGTVSAPNSEHKAGIAGYNGETVENCFTVSGTTLVGKDSTGISSGEILEKEEFADKTKFPTFDFDKEKIWVMGEERPLLSGMTVKITF